MSTTSRMRSVAAAATVDHLDRAPLPQLPEHPVRRPDGALIGAVLYKTNRGSLLTGAVVGGLGAVAGSYAAMHLRKLTAERTPLKEPWTGLVEDALTVATGQLLLNSRQPGH